MKRVIKPFVISILVSVVFLMSFVAHNVRALDIVISGNGSAAQNEVNTIIETNNQVTQANTAEITNHVDAWSNSGGNQTSENTGSASIETGNVTQNISISNSVNSSAANLPCCPESTAVVITNNGTDSNNTANVNSSNNTQVTVSQSAYIKNNISGKANTGENAANSNGGSVSIVTGNIYARGEIVNGPVNVYNVVGAGGNGISSFLISENGSGSVNKVNYNSIFSSNLNFSNNSNIFNFVSWDLNTGRNSANKNLGDVKISTGDILFDLFVKNGPVNIGGVFWDCCGIFDPGQKDEDGKGDGSQEDKKDEKEEGENGGGGGGGGGSVTSAAAATEAGGPGLLGLSDTSSEGAQALFFFLGLLLLTLGVRYLALETSRYNSSS